MAALLVGLRWRQLGHQLARNPWMIVTLVLVGLSALGMLGLGALGLGALRALAPDAAAPTLVLLGSIVVAGWWLGSILVSADDALAPERFALLPVRAGALLPGLVLAGALGIGGVGTAVALLLMLVGWSVSWPALVAALVTAPVALATCVLGARVVSGLLARWLARRRTRDVVVLVGVLLVACSGMLLNVAIAALSTLETAGSSLQVLSEVLAWTPVGAVFGVPAAIVDGAWLAAGARLVIALATVALLWVAARALLAARLVAPVTDSGGGTVRGGRLLDRMLPATPAGAIAARTLRYRRRDPRHLINAVMLVVLPAILIGVQLMQGVRGEALEFAPAVVLVPAINALLVASIAQMDLAYDHDTLTLHMLTGVKGADDRAGRLLGIAVLVVPVTVLLCVAACALVGDWGLLPASLGAALGLTLVAMGAGIALGPVLPGRAPAPEANPLGRGSSGGVQSMLALLVMLPVTLVVGAPALGLAIAALWTPALGWASLACGLLVGGAALWAGVAIGGRLLDRRWPEVLVAVTSEG